MPSHADLDEAHRQTAAEVLTALCERGEVKAASHVRHRRQLVLESLVDRLGPTQTQHVGEHCDRVGALAGELARCMSLTHEAIEDAAVAGVLHDIGKCAIPEALLALPRSLDTEEWLVMATHAELGACMAEQLGAGGTIVAAVRLHHERFEDAPPLLARLLNVADALTTMLSDRQYRRAMPLDNALAELRREAGGQFDPAVVDAAHDVSTDFIRRAA